MTLQKSDLSWQESLERKEIRDWVNSNHPKSLTINLYEDRQGTLELVYTRYGFQIKRLFTYVYALRSFKSMLAYGIASMRKDVIQRKQIYDPFLAGYSDNLGEKYPFIVKLGYWEATAMEIVKVSDHFYKLRLIRTGHVFFGQHRQELIERACLWVREKGLKKN